jgi:hypothetical protein
MKFNIVVDINEWDIVEAMELNNCTKQEAIDQITNVFYLGLSCIDGMLHRTTGIDCTDSYVEKN